jgi:hypothetical protein
MTQNQIFDLLKSVFTEFDIKIVNSNSYFKIFIDMDLTVYTYSGLPEREDSIWYFNCHFYGSSKETEIPNKDALEFIQVYKDIYMDIIKSREITSSINKRLQAINDIANIRDKKINKIINV